MDTECDRLIQEFQETRRQAYFHPEPYRAAARALRAREQADVMATFDVWLQNADLEIRANALEIMALLYKTGATETIMRSLADDSEIVRAVACGCLHDFGDQRAQAALLDRLKHDSDPQVRGVAADALGQLGGAEVLQDLDHAWQTDHIADEQGHTPAGYAYGSISDILRHWVQRQIQGTPPRNFQEATTIGQLSGRVVIEAIPFDVQGRLFHTARYKDLPRSACGDGLSTYLDLQTTLVSPFEIDVAYTDPHRTIRRAFIFHHYPDDPETNWAIQTIVDPTALYGADDERR